VKRHNQTVGPWPVAAMVGLLLLCSVSGLAAGVYARSTRSALGGSMLGSLFSPGTTAGPGGTASGTPTPSPTPTVPAVPATVTGFQIVVAAPASIAAGQQFTVTATATLPGTHGGTPVPNLECFMRAPTPQRTPLLQEWPAPTYTDASGRATWTLIAPQVAPGSYGIEVVAYGTGKYFYYGDAYITVTPS
jgi:hypothetical protein